MSIREDAIMMLLSGEGGGDIAELTVDANGTYEAVNYTNVDGVATLITDPDTQKSLDGFNPVNVQIDIEEEKKKAYDEGYSDGYVDGQKDPDPPYIDVINDLIGDDESEPFTGTDEEIQEQLDEWYATHPYIDKPPYGTTALMRILGGEHTVAGHIEFSTFRDGFGEHFGIFLVRPNGERVVFAQYRAAAQDVQYSGARVTSDGYAEATIDFDMYGGVHRTVLVRGKIPETYDSGTPFSFTVQYVYTNS